MYIYDFTLHYYSENLEGWYWDHYKTTAKMSTYLIAFVVSEYTSETSPASLFHGKPVKVSLTSLAF